MGPQCCDCHAVNHLMCLASHKVAEAPKCALMQIISGLPHSVVSQVAELLPDVPQTQRRRLLHSKDSRKHHWPSRKHGKPTKKPTKKHTKKPVSSSFPA